METTMPTATVPGRIVPAAPGRSRQRVRGLQALFWLAPLVCGIVGCSSLGRPDWLAPGPARSQQRRAVRFDPYLQDDVGPSLLRLPLVDGGRPRDYAEPVPEVRRARWWAAGR